MRERERERERERTKEESMFREVVQKTDRRERLYSCIWWQSVIVEQL